MPYARYLSPGRILVTFLALSIAMPLAQSQRSTTISTLDRVISVEINTQGAVATYTDHYSISKFSLVEEVQQSVLYVRLPNPYARQILEYPSSFEFKELPKAQQNPFNITKEAGGIKLAASRDSLVLGAEGAYVNFSISYRMFLRSEVVGSNLRNITLPMTLEGNFPIEIFSVSITLPANMLVGNTNASWNFFERLDVANYTLIWQKPSFHNASELLTTSLQLQAQSSNIVIPAIIKNLKFDPFTGLHVEEGYYVNTDKYASVSDLPSILLPVGAYDVGSRDLIGALKDTGIVPVANTSRSYAKVSPRIRLFYGTNYTFFVSYRLPLANYTTRVDDIVTVTIPLASNYTDFAEHYSLKVELPIGAKLMSVEFMDKKLNAVVQQGDTYSSELSYITRNIMDMPLKVTFSYSPLWAGYTPSMILFASGLVLLGAYYARSKRLEPLVAEGAEPRTTLADDLVHVAKKQLALQSQIEELELRYFEGQVSRREFRSMYENLKGDLDRRTAEMAAMSKKLRERSPQYNAKMSAFEGLQTDLRARHASLREIGFNYLNKKIPRSTYEELSPKYSEEITGVVSKIRAFLEEL